MKLIPYILVLNSRLVQRSRRKRIGCSQKMCFLGKNVVSNLKGVLEIAENVSIADNTSFCFNPIDNNLPVIKIGKGCSIGKYNDFGCSECITIEDNVITAPFLHITDRDHCFENINIPVMHQSSRVKGPVRIGQDSWIGFGVQIMSGVTIGRHCIIAAGAIVTRNIPDYCVAGGNPARILKKFDIDSRKWIRV